MSTDSFTQRFAKHGLHSRLSECIVVIDEALRQKPGGPSEKDRLDRLKDGMQWLLRRLGAVNPWLAGAATLHRIEQSLLAVEQGVRNYLSDGNASHLKAPTIQFEDTLVPTMESLPRIESPEDVVQLASTIDEASRKTETYLASIEALISAAKAELEKRQEELGALKLAIGDQSNRITKQNDRLDAVVADFNRGAATLEQQREERFVAFQSELAEKFEKSLQPYAVDIDRKAKSTSADADSIIKDLNDMLTDARQIFSAIGNTALTGDYKKSADDNEKSADYLRNGAVIALVGMALIVAFIAFDAVSGSVGWQVATFRLTATLALAILAGYLAKESSSHRNVARRMRRLELELASIDAFTALIPPEQRQPLKVELAKRYFGAGQEEKEQPELTTKEILKEFRATMRAIRR